jgi:transcriptional/translational regulatory protein YebC/TACO1
MGGDSSWANILRRARVVAARRAGSGTRARDAPARSVRYEGYGPGGSAVLIDTLTTDRRVFEAALRRIFTDHGGHLGAAASVSYLFNHVGRLCYPPGTDAPRLTRLALEAGAEDIGRNSDGSVEVLTDPPEFTGVLERLTEQGFAPASAEVTWRAGGVLELSGERAVRMRQLLEELEALDGVLDVYSNVELPAEELNA